MFYYGKVEAIRNKHDAIPDFMLNPHYLDTRFTRDLGARTIYLAQGLFTPEDHGALEIPGVHYAYDDRIQSEIGRDTYETARNADKTAKVILQNVFAGTPQFRWHPDVP